MKPESIVSTARDCLGVPWRHQGRDPRIGLDCVGFILHCLTTNSWAPQNGGLLEWTNYSRISTNDRLREAAISEGIEISLEDLQPGDMAIFKFEGDDFGQHIGLVTNHRTDGVLYLIHSSNEEGKVIEHRLSKQWRDRFLAGVRFVGGAHG